MSGILVGMNSQDFLFIGLSLAFFALAAGYAAFCSRIR